ncbi:accessory factor UbiK family protein [Pelagibius sp. Alg239-R121]|uniref:accessory factor UbiK family protein n=1 Tax=Pelagibius sp. Alg239-R121 TaxID=2993448 RepID=UPI002AC3456D|nr:accessory factor UbiK family protein [Pelagibius sp. Alg239-R121]
MQTQNRFLDDLARVTSGAMGVAAGVRGEVEARVREQLERVLAQMDLVPREEFEVVKAMAAKARSEQEVLSERLAQLEALLAEKEMTSGSVRQKSASSAKKAKQKAKPGAKSTQKPASKPTASGDGAVTSESE